MASCLAARTRPRALLCAIYARAACNGRSSSRRSYSSTAGELDLAFHRKPSQVDAGLAGARSAAQQSEDGASRDSWLVDLSADHSHGEISATDEVKEVEKLVGAGQPYRHFENLH